MRLRPPTVKTLNKQICEDDFAEHLNEQWCNFFLSTFIEIGADVEDY